MDGHQKGLYYDAFETVPVAPLGIICMPGCEELGRRVNDYLTRWRDSRENTDQELYTFPGYERETFLLNAVCSRFGTGEGKGMLKQSVRGYDLYIICDVTAYQIEYQMYGRTVPMSPDDHYQDLKRLIQAASGKAHRMNVVMPLLYGGRQHRRSYRESLDCAYMLQELQHMGVSNLLTFDAHDPRVQNAVPVMGFDNLMPEYQVLKKLFKDFPDLSTDKNDFMIVSPDEGALNRNMHYASVLGVELGMFYKRRDYSRIVDGRNPIVAHEYLGASVEGKDVFVADDIISSGESVLDIAENVKERRANRFFAYATYAIFTNGLEKFDKAYEQGLIDGIFGSNLTYLKPELRNRPWFHEVDVSKYIAYFISALNHDVSISSLLDPHSKIEALLKKRALERAKYADEQLSL